MSNLGTSYAQPILPPIFGVNKKSPLVKMPEGMSPWLENVDCENGYNKVRGGISRHLRLSDDAYFIGMGAWGGRGYPTATLFAYALNNTTNKAEIWDVTTSPATRVRQMGTALPDECTAWNYAGRLAFSTEAAHATYDAVWDGATWAAWGFTDGGSAVDGRVSTYYKTRPHIITSDGKIHWSDDTFSVTGTMSNSDYSSLFTYKSTPVWSGTISASAASTNETYYCFGLSSGEVFIYGGDYPDSSTWYQVAKYMIGEPLSFQSCIAYENDLLILTKTGVVSIRDLMSYGQEALLTRSFSANINAHWTKLVKNLGFGTYPTSWASGCFWPEKNKIYILIAGYLNEDGTFDSNSGTMYVYNRETQAWSWYKLGAVVTNGTLGGLTYFEDNIYFFSNKSIMKMASSGFMDEDSETGTAEAYTADIRTQYVGLEAGANKKRPHAVSPIFNTDFSSANVGVSISSDIGRTLTGASKPTIPSGLSNPYYSVGTDGLCYQVRITVQTQAAKTTGLELYGLAAIYEPGGVR